MERKNMMIKKIVIYGLLLITTLSTYLSYHLYKENQYFKIGMGAEYHATVVKTLNRINENDISFWVETLKSEEDGDVLLERYIDNLNELVKGYDRMNANVGIIGIQIKHLTEHYRELESNLDEGKDIEIYKEEISMNIKFIRDVLTQVQSDLGHDKSEILWYTELSNDETKTANYIWKEFKNFEKESK
ncbi:hypothetical protein SAMN05880501_10870 [Ureibacillus xyleni]|uniref:Uncharacterized protein n=1 Tax=Ureibacillus xyleni TaxID=614648 RepID=A0A285T2P7_9BACL|nr:hypothetical protein [Ureibacillus xyleni]SOC15314.1 hypothetical protein SAMN05880501_10870 [Ureibacillus xyleni]